MTPRARTRVATLLAASLFGGCASEHALRSPLAAKKVMGTERDGDELRTDQPDAAARYWAGLHQTPPGRTASELNLEAIAEIEPTRSLPPPPNFRIESWGPGNYGGRLRGILIKPTDSTKMLVGSVAGGVWKSTDSGGSWHAVNDFLPTLAVGSMLVDPDEPNRVFVGTGEGFFNIDAAQGLGIFVSTNFGDSFTTLAGTDNSSFYYVNRLVAIPGTNKLLAATRTGIWGTDDFTAVTPVWTERSGFVTSSRGFVDLKLDPSTTTPNARVYAFHYGGSDASDAVWRSGTDGAAATWSQLGAAQGIPTTTVQRMEIAVGTDGVVYLAVANSTDATRGLWRSPAGGNAFVQTASATAFIERQGWYDLIAGVKPGDSNTVLVGAVDMYKSTNAGATITKKTFWNPGVGQVPDDYVHADLHVVTFDPSNANNVFIGCDGGIFKSTDSGETWNDLDHDLRVAQYYGIAVHPNGENVIGGTQDNGSHLYFGDPSLWVKWAGGDGGFSAWDQQQPQFVYGATPQGGLFGSSNGGSTNTAIALPSVSGAPFITPFVIDPNNGNRMIVGTNKVYYSANIRSIAGATFSNDTGTISTVSALAISPHNGNVAYAGTSNGRLYRTTTLGTPSTWAQLQDASWAGSDVTWIEVDPHDLTGNTLYVTLADYAANRAWKSTNGGTSWFTLDAGLLPDIPMFSLRVDPRDSDRLWLGTELGLWTTDGNDTNVFGWVQYGYGTAWTRVIQLVWGTPDVLSIGTHGRSIFKASRSTPAVYFGALDDSAGGCDTDGILDPSETGSLPVALRNDGALTMNNVVVSLSSTFAGLQVLSGPMNYGNIGVGATVSASFNLSLGYPIPQCRFELPIDVTITDTESTTVQRLTLFTGADPAPAPLTEDAEDADTAFTHVAAVGADDWQRTNTQAHTGTFSWFSADIDGLADKSLVSPWLTVGGGSTTLGFWLRYDLEGDGSQYWDGVVLELQVAGSSQWVDVGSLSSVPYDGQLFNNNTAPLRNAWSGTQTTWRNATVSLGGTYNGQRVRFRFRLIADEGAANVGFWLDDLSVTNVTWPACDLTGCRFIFTEDFETGNTSRWGSTVQ